MDVPLPLLKSELAGSQAISPTAAIIGSVVGGVDVAVAAERADRKSIYAFVQEAPSFVPLASPLTYRMTALACTGITPKTPAINTNTRTIRTLTTLKFFVNISLL